MNITGFKKKRGELCRERNGLRKQINEVEADRYLDGMEKVEKIKVLKKKIFCIGKHTSILNKEIRSRQNYETVPIISGKFLGKQKRIVKAKKEIRPFKKKKKVGKRG